MNVPFWVWAATIGGLLVLIAIDLIIVDRKPHEVTTGEAARWVTFYVSCAVLFGIGVWVFGGHDPGVEFFTGYITEYSLSVDNLFIFMVIMSSFKVPSIHQHRVLLIGILIALVMRGAFIAVGAALIAQFVWIFFVFGAVLVWTAVNMVRGKDEDENPENAVTRWVRKTFPVTDDYVGHHSVVKQNGKRYITPMFVVIVAIGSADLLFAVDSIPAIFGITQDAFLVFAANAFALMGLRQLYFLLGGLVNKLVYLSYGLAIILGFIGLKLVLHALHEYHVTPSWLEINNWMSLGVIVTVLVVTTVLSLRKAKRDPDSVGHTGLNLRNPTPEEREAQEAREAEGEVQAGSTKDETAGFRTEN
ncbi:tellurium resistance protein TerC [Prauserella marina]|uniref:Tellurite resistance protein TerC n=1 Tax=Prauserella marina TaxID=530584 RepID=A0A222VT89_9PSEU|nr:TerC family protein [Prauserella marina]ASR37147.1 tellurium resistance protein TerC [Prauserella marina]PWV72454.1 tellurite resistance protein TerC [Prauserella marina]SDD79693.1 tellurite resistance protein TerC [Prauserella marina]